MKKMYFLIMLMTLTFLSVLDANSSNSKGVGKGLSLPYTCDFESADVFNSWTIIDANADGKTWMGVYSVNPKTARCAYNNVKNADDWLISPAIALEAGKKYRLTFDTKSFNKIQLESMKVFYGKGATVGAQTTLLADYPAIPAVVYSTESVALCPIESGDYNVGFYNYSIKKGYFLDVTKVRIEEMQDNDMQALSLYGQVMPKINKEYTYFVKIKNNGGATQSDYKVQLIDGKGEVLVTQEVNQSIETYETKEIAIKWTPTKIEEIAIYAKVVLVGDQLTDNDNTELIEIDIQPDSDDEWAVIGNGKEKEGSPIEFWVKNSASQVLYLEEEIGFIGMVNKLIYSYCNEKSHNIQDRPIKIYMASTELMDLSGGFIPESKMTLVFDGKISMLQKEGELEIELTTPFIHSGGNLCITTTHSFTDNQIFDNVKFFGTTNNTTNNRTLIYASSNSFNWTQISRNPNIVTNIKILATTAGDGGKIEGKITNNGVAMEGVRVMLSPSDVSTSTDVNGNYVFGFVPAGDYTVTAYKYGFEKGVITEVSPVTYQPTVVNMDLPTLPKHTFVGTVIDYEENKIEGAIVTIKGYDNHNATTDSKGTFTIDNIYKDNGYIISIEKSGYITYVSTFDVNENSLSLLITMMDSTNPPLMVSATASDSNVDLKWTEPSEVTTFRYDDGEVKGHFGFTSAGMPENGVVGSAYKTPAVLNSMSWYTVGRENAGGPHPTVNIFVMDLDKNGKPTTDVIFSQMNVPNNDDQWTTFNFPYPIECPNGFLVGISYNGFAGLAHDTGISQEWPFATASNYYTVNYKNTPFQDMSGDSKEYNFLVRANGHKIDSSKKLQGYKVWRLAEIDQENESNWNLITTNPISEETYTDNSWSTVAKGAYKYAVKALYRGENESAPYFSNMVSKGMTSDVTFKINTNTLSNESAGATITLINIDGNDAHVYTGTVAENNECAISNVWKGIYSVCISLSGFNTMTINDVTIDNDVVLLEYTIEEMTIEPYNLSIKETSKQNERIFNWNTGNMEDDFERHEDFTVNSPGSIGWNYIDEDGMNTLALKNYMFPNAGSKMAYIVFNPSTTTPPMHMGVDPNFEPFSGNKYLASLPILIIAPIPVNDLFISPELSFSREFTFSLWAMGGESYDNPGKMKVGYSIEGNEYEDFTNWLTPTEVSVKFMEWTKYTYTVPAEAKYVTINCVSYKAGMLRIDDVFIGIEPSKAMVEYEVYLDDKMVDKSSSTFFNFTNLTEGKHTAGVKAVYSSGATKMATVDFNVTIVGINDMNDVKLRIYPNPVTDVLKIEGEYSSLEIYNAIGKLMKIYDRQSESNSAISQIDVSDLENGIYIIKAYNNGNVKTYKIVK